MIAPSLGLGDVAEVDGSEAAVIALAGNTVTLRDVDGNQSCWSLPDLLNNAGSIDRGAASGRVRADDIAEPVPQAVGQGVLDLEAHILDSLGQARHGDDAPLPHYDPSRTSQAERDATKLAELRTVGESVSLRTWQRRRAAYQECGLAGPLSMRRAASAWSYSCTITTAKKAAAPVKTHTMPSTSEMLLRLHRLHWITCGQKGAKWYTFQVQCDVGRCIVCCTEGEYPSRPVVNTLSEPAWPVRKFGRETFSIVNSVVC